MPNFTHNVMCISRYILKSIGGCRLFAAAFLDVMWCVCMYGTWARLKLDWLPCDWPCVVLRYGIMRQVDSDKKRIKKRKKKRERESCDYVNQQGKRLIMGCVSLDVIPTTSRWRMDAPLMYTIMLPITIYPDRYTHTAHTCIYTQSRYRTYGSSTAIIQ